MSTVVPYSTAAPARAQKDVALFTVSTHSIDETRESLEKLLAAATVGLRILDKVDIYGEAEVLRAVADTLNATISLIET